MASKIDRIANLLASGVQPSMVAKITGVTPSYISQLCSDQDFSNHLSELKLELVTTDSNEDKETELLADKLLGAEHKIVDRIIDRLDLMSDGHVIAAYAKISERRDSLTKQAAMASVAKTLNQTGATVRMVELTIPAIAAPEIIFGKNNEIVSIGNRSITPMPTAALQKMIQGEVIDYEDPYATL